MLTVKKKPMDNSELLNHSKKWDRTGIIISSLCLIHCIALPFLFVLIPALNFYFKNSFFEISLLALAISVGSVSFITSYKKHKKAQPLLLGLIGVLLLSANLVVDLYHQNNHLLDSLHINPVMILGGLCLFSGHIWNIHACHCFCDHSCAHEEHHDH